MGLTHGTLDVTGSMASARNILLSDASTIEVSAGQVYTESGVIYGSGSLTVGSDSSGEGGTLVLTASNTYDGGTEVTEGQTVGAGSNTALGTGTVSLDAGSTLAFNADGLVLANAIVLNTTLDPTIDTGSFTETLAGDITGAGSLTKEGTGTLITTGANTYTGATDIAAGTLQAGVADTFSANSDYTVETGTTLDANGFDQTIAGLTNNGSVNLVGTTAGTTLTVAGNYTGAAGSLITLGVALGDDSSMADKLVI